MYVQANYIKDRGLAGAMVWSMDNDDFNNHCGQGAWPLLTTLRQYLPDDRSVSLSLEMDRCCNVFIHIFTNSFTHLFMYVRL